MYLPNLTKSLWPNLVANVNKIVEPASVAKVTVKTIKKYFELGRALTVAIKTSPGMGRGMPPSSMNRMINNPR